MKINIAKNELQIIRDIIRSGRDAYRIKRKDVQFDYQYKYHKEMFDCGTKLIKKINSALKKVCGHDCCGDGYLK